MINFWHIFQIFSFYAVLFNDIIIEIMIAFLLRRDLLVESCEYGSVYLVYITTCQINFNHSVLQLND